jgi:hypothetical protein
VVKVTGPKTLTRQEIREVALNFSRSKSLRSMGFGFDRFSMPSITVTTHFAQIPMALQELPIGFPAAIIDDIKFEPLSTSIKVLSAKVTLIIPNSVIKIMISHNICLCYQDVYV